MRKVIKLNRSPSELDIQTILNQEEYFEIAEVRDTTHEKKIILEPNIELLIREIKQLKLEIQNLKNQIGLLTK